MNRRKFLKIACYGGIATLFASYPVLIERNLVQINNYRIPVPGLPKAFNGVRIVHLTDLHFGFLVHGVPVNPVEWWDSHWIKDNIHKKLNMVEKLVEK